MNCEIKNNTVVVVINNQMKEFNLDNLDYFGLSFSKASGKVVIDEKLSKQTILQYHKPTSTFKGLLRAASNPAPAVNTKPVLTYEMLINNGWTREQVAASAEYKHLVPKLTPEAPTEKTAEPCEKDGPETIGTRGAVREFVPRRSSNRKAFKRGPNKLALMSSDKLAHLYVAYRQNVMSVNELAKMHDTKKSTIYNWCSIMTRLIAGTSFNRNPSPKLAMAANQVIAERLLETTEKF